MFCRPSLKTCRSKLSQCLSGSEAHVRSCKTSQPLLLKWRGQGSEKADCHCTRAQSSCNDASTHGCKIRRISIPERSGAGQHWREVQHTCATPTFTSVVINDLNPAPLRICRAAAGCTAQDVLKQDGGAAMAAAQQHAARGGKAARKGGKTKKTGISRTQQLINEIERLDAAIAEGAPPAGSSAAHPVQSTAAAGKRVLSQR